MKHQKWLFLEFIVAASIFLGGCGVLDRDQPEDLEGLVATQIAQTQDAQEMLETIVAATMTAMPTAEQKLPEEETPTEEAPTAVATQTATPTFIPTDTPTAEPTPTTIPTTAVPMVEVSVPTHCRTGPGKIYDQVSVLGLGKQVEVIARNAFGNYWVVENPGGEGVCWLWGEYATITGSTANLPLWETPPTPTPQAGLTSTPAAVTLQVSIPTNCRVGPGIPYEIVTILQEGKTAKVVARHASADFWVIENPAGEGTCWVWGEHATFTGPKEKLPIQDPPAIETGISIEVSVDTYCRTGPGIPYDVVTIFKIGRTADVVGKHATADFWVIENPAGEGTCWVWGEYATLTGATANVPVWNALSTPTPAPVTLKVSVDTNCRTGPGKPYDIITIFKIGKTADVIGRNAAQTYWVIENPEGSGHCWVWGKYATLTGPAANLPIYDPPATPTPKP